MLHSKVIDYRDVELLVEFEYIEDDGDGFHDPYVPAHIIIEDIYAGDVSVYTMLLDQQLYEIEKEILP